MGDIPSPSGSACTPLSQPSPQLPTHGMSVSSSIPSFNLSHDPASTLLLHQMAKIRAQLIALAKKVMEKDRPSHHEGSSQCRSER